MLAAVWHVESVEFAVDEFLHTVELTPDMVWHSGDRAPRGRVFETSGFSLSLDTEENTEESSEGLLVSVRSFLADNQHIFAALQKYHVASWIDIGFTVGTDAHFTRNLRLSNEDLMLLARSGLTLQVSAYPGHVNLDVPSQSPQEQPTS